MRFAYAKSIGLRRLAYGGGGASASEQLLTLATAAGAEAVYDPDNEDTWTLRDDGSDLWYSAISDGLGNREDMVQATAADQPQQITLSNGRRAILKAATEFMVGDFASVITQPNTVLVVGEPNRVIAGSRQYMMDGEKVTGGRQIVGVDTDTWAMRAGVWLRGGANDTKWTILQGNFNGANSELFRNDASLATGDAGTDDLGGVALFDNNTDTIRLGPIIVFSDLKTNAELSDIRDHLSANWPIGSET